MEDDVEAVEDPRQIPDLIRALGPQWHQQWGQITLSHLRQIGFNTVGNWSDWQGASGAGFPYVCPIQFEAKH